MTSPQQTWERLAAALEESDGAVSRSTMMGLPCLRTGGAFFASLDTRSGRLVVKLPADEVARRVERGEGHPFAPAGRAFREWLALDAGSDGTWRAALLEALVFVRGS